MDTALERTLDPIEGRRWTRLRKDFQVGSEGWNDVAFAGQRIRWTQDSQNGPYVEVSRNKANWGAGRDPSGTKHEGRPPLHSVNAHTAQPTGTEKIGYRAGTQFQCSYKISRCASMAPSPTLGDVESLDKLARQLKSQPVKLQYWPLAEQWRILGFPDASYRNNDDGSSQRGMTVFLAESRERSSKDGMSQRSLADYESQKINKIVLSTTVAELYSFMKCLCSCQFVRGCGWIYLVR